MQFEWDEAKAEINKRKHGASFSLAARVFLDPHRAEQVNEDFEEEIRWQTIGLVEGIELFVVFTIRERTIRLSPQGELSDISGKSTGTVFFEMDLESPAALTDGEREQLARLRSKSDTEIDFSDTPPSRVGSTWLRPGKRFSLDSVVLLEEEVLEFFRTNGPPDADKVNAVLREYIRAHAKLG